MSWSEDDWGKPIFPTRFGSPQGHATERKMLDAVGGFDGIRTKIRTNPDGSVTTMKTRGGMPVFTTVQKAIQTIAAVLKYASLFYCIPSSAAHAEGYTPDGAAGAVSRVEDWHLLTNIPTNVNLNRVAAWAGGAGSKGNTTWYSESVKVEGQPLVVSWLTDGIRVGRYGVGTNSSVSTATRAEWNHIPGHTTAFQLPTQANTPLCHNWIWLNGVVRLTLPVLIMSVGIRANTDIGKPRHELFVIAVDGGIYSGSLDAVLTVSAGVVSINLGADGSDFSVSQTGTISGFADYQLMQWPFMNGSATKAVMLRDTYAGQDGSKNTLYEVTLDTGVQSVVDVENVAIRDKADTVCTSSYSSTGTPDDSTSTDVASSYFPTESYLYRFVSGADYVGDNLTYLTVEYSSASASTRYTKNISTSHTLTRNGSGDITNVSSSKGRSEVYTREYSPTQPKVTLINSYFGEMLTLTEVAAGGVVENATVTENYSFNGTYTEWGNHQHDIVKTMSSNWPACTYVPMVLNGDLRTNTVLFSTLTYREYVSVNLTDTTTVKTNSNDVVSNSHSETRYYKYSEELKVFLQQGGTTLFSETTDFSEPIETFGGSTSLPIPWFGNYSAAGLHTEKATETPLSYVFPEGNVFGSEEICPRIASLAVSPDGTVAHCGFSGFHEYFGPSVKKEVFVINGAVHSVPANTYSPGGDDTLASAIFFPKTVIK